LYSYTYDEQTGGLLLNSTPTHFSKEPRPVYYRELDLLGFSKYCKYEKQDEIPYMWAEANYYYYRGRQVAKLKGGNLYDAPELIINLKEDGKTPELDGDTLIPVDLSTMVTKNSELLEIIEQTTVKKILGIYKKYKNKLDIFHVAFSGGKDSVVLLDLIKKALPKGSFVVVFGDTGMEFPDTYVIVDKVEKQCKEEGITFRRAKSHFNAKESWGLFGPPSRILRWCCSVHKGAPQVTEMRNLLGINNYQGLAFVGIRAHESLKRSEYEYENLGKKQKGQYSHNSILEWTSTEIWLYMFSNGLIINEAYKKGNSRAGCLFCPMSSGVADFIRHSFYKAQIDDLAEVVTSSIDWGTENQEEAKVFITNGAWSARRSGRVVKNNERKYIETKVNGITTIEIRNPRTDWKEWIKTIGTVVATNDKYILANKTTTIEFSLSYENTGYIIRLAEAVLKADPSFGKLFRQVFRKAAYCVGCRVCESNCRQGQISFVDGVKISDKCVQCHECHEVPCGCLVYDSLKIPQEERNVQSIDSFNSHAPKNEWIFDFFNSKDVSLVSSSLGPNQKRYFKRFLKDSGLIDKTHLTPTFNLVEQKGLESETSWGILLTNLAYNPQFKWYIKNLSIGSVYLRKTVLEMLQFTEVNDKEAKFIIGAFKRFVETPLGTKLKFGYVTDGGELVRTTCTVTDYHVILYALYKFAEKCDGYWQFTLTRLLDHNVDSDGISPTEIFGLDRAAMEPILLGLTNKYPDFINASFTGDLDKISLRNDKTSADVLDLFYRR
jgi:phosphoadenosine phosphosulfate reductase